MDWHNNIVGMRLVVEDGAIDIAQAVFDAWQGGELQEWACPNHPTDKEFGCIPPDERW